MPAEKGKFVRMFGRSEIRLTACAVIKKLNIDDLLKRSELGADYFEEPNQFWNRDPNHERALLKIYQNQKAWIHYFENSLLIQIVGISMPFLGHDSSDGWGELQFLIKEPAAVKLARYLSFDTRVNKWVEETKLIQPRTDLGTHSYLALRFYHQDYKPGKPKNWRFEPVYVSVRNSAFYRIDVSWEKEEITITTTQLEKDSPEIPKHLK